MLQGVFQRAAVAILLIGTLIAPAQICLQHAHKTGHACCISMFQPGATIQNDCCAVRPTPPAVVVAPALSGTPTLSAVQEFVSSKERSSLSALTISAVLPSHSPPRGSSVLRI
jgi:hypothetical protein